MSITANREISDPSPNTIYSADATDFLCSGVIGHDRIIA